MRSPCFESRRALPLNRISHTLVHRTISGWFYAGHNPNNDAFDVRPEFMEIRKGNLPKVKFQEYARMPEYRDVQTRMLGADSFPYRNITVDEKVNCNSCKCCVCVCVCVHVCIFISTSIFEVLLISIHEWLGSAAGTGGGGSAVLRGPARRNGRLGAAVAAKDGPCREGKGEGDDFDV